MVYTKTVWVSSTAPGISATNLNNLETQYDSAIADLAGTATPLIASTSQTVGTSTKMARQDHIHPIAGFVLTTHSTTARISNNSEENIMGSTWAILKTITPWYNVCPGGTIRLNVDFRSSTIGQAGVYCAGAGTLNTVYTTSTAFTTVTTDCTYIGGTITLYGMYTTSVNSSGVVKNFQLCCDTTPASPTWAMSTYD